jgi:hypothetical protein
LSASTIAAPVEPLKPVSHASRCSEGGIFALVRVGVADHEAVELQALQLRAQRLDARGAVAARGAVLEGLEFGFEHGGVLGREPDLSMLAGRRPLCFESVATRWANIGLLLHDFPI